ncbi:MAG: endonuclease/exonuclease/phosphatase family protein [Phycisphaerales bacterium]|nr:endonuclease/exonuclease/phosphatase family protein [Phycisphaerales bacterium]
MRTWLACLTALVAPAWAQTMLVDGKFGDWPREAACVVDPSGDSTGELDATLLKGVLAGNTVHVCLEIAETRNIQAGAQTDPDLMLRIEPDGLPALEMACRGRVIRRMDNGQAVRWDAVRFAGAPTFAAERFEMRFDLSVLGTVGPEGVRLSLSGCDELSEVVVLREAAREELPAPAAIEPEGKPSLRLASLNTWRTGLLAPAQAPQLTRLLKATEADVYLLQEEYNSSAAQLMSIFNTMRPLPGGASWQVHKRGDTAVVSRFPLIVLPNYDTSYSAAAIQTGQGPVVVASVHPKCCGYIGSTEDQQRITQAGLAARLIEEIRAGQHNGQAGLSEAPVIIGGDWNLVGSRGPLDRLTDPQLADMAELGLVRTGAADTATWREPGGLGFAPGRLDLVVYDRQRLKALKAEIWDTSLMSEETLARLGLRGNDSDGSDHFLLVAEFAFKAGS